MTALDRRGFLRVTAQGTAAIALVGASSSLLTVCDPSELKAPDANGLRLLPGFTSRVVATTGQVVPGTAHVWHTAPDGGACFKLPGGGWSYVSNCEWVPGGVGYLRFNSSGAITGAGSALAGSIINCAGGVTPWGTWLTCEEYDGGQVWECDPTGAVPGVARPEMGRFAHEAAAADPARKVIYLTEDKSDGCLYRFHPTTWGDLSSGTLKALSRTTEGKLVWRRVPDPDGSSGPTRNQVPGALHFAGGEGADMSRGRLVFTTKGDNKVWTYDPKANTLTVIYERGVQANGVLSGVDNVETSRTGVIYVAEDGDDMQIVLVREDGRTFPVLQLTGVSDSEITGPAFDPSGTRLYFSSQRNPGRTYEVTGNWKSFAES